MSWICPRCGSSYVTKTGRVISCSQCKTKIAELDEPEHHKVVAPRSRA